MGAFDYLWNLCTLTRTKGVLLRRKRKKPLQTVELKVKMDCEGCERKVRNAAKSLRGVTSVEVIRKQNRVIIKGFLDPNKVVKRIKRKTGKKSVEFWPYVPLDTVTYPHASYDKRAPAGYVKKVANQDPWAPEERYVHMFNDDNTNACSVM